MKRRDLAFIGQGYRAIYCEAHILLEDIAEAALDGNRKEHMELLAIVPLLIIDDLGMRKLGPTAAEELLEIVMRRHRHARSASSPRPYPQMRAAELEDQVAGGTMSPKTSRKATTSTMGGPEKMQPRSSKRDFFEPRGGNDPPPGNFRD